MTAMVTVPIMPTVQVAGLLRRNNLPGKRVRLHFETTVSMLSGQLPSKTHEGRLVDSENGLLFSPNSRGIEQVFSLKSYHLERLVGVDLLS